MLPNIQTQDGDLSSMRGLSWLGVEMISRFFNSQTQPEPKRPTAAAANCSWN